MLVLLDNKNGHKTHKSEDFTRSIVCCTGSIMSDTVLFQLFKLLHLPCKESVILIEVGSRLCVKFMERLLLFCFRDTQCNASLPHCRWAIEGNSVFDG